MGLFKPLKIKNVEFKNRILMPPMVQYCANFGEASSWHSTHYESRAIGGAGSIIVESSAISEEGRISNKCLGIWQDSHLQGLSNLANLIKKHNAVAGIQINHAGRKSMCERQDKEPYPLLAPSNIAFSSSSKIPIQMSKKDIQDTISLFSESFKRAKKAGFDLVEIHAAHGYLLSSFLSPLSNKRKDEYGKDRSLILKELFEEISPSIGDTLLSLRISACDYNKEGNTKEDFIKLLACIKDKIDLLHVSSGGVTDEFIKTYAGYQIPLAKYLKEELKIPVAGGGLIKDCFFADELIRHQVVDLVFLGRELLINPYFPLQASIKLGVEVKDFPSQYIRAK